MAQLTLSQKSQMLATPSFLERVKMAIVAKAHYWNNVLPANQGDYNLQMQKRKRYAKRIINGDIPDAFAFAGFVLQLYTTANPDLNSDNQLSDEVLAGASSGTYFDPPFDYYAGTQPSDADEPIIW
jgi:hypothetical protein